MQQHASGDPGLAGARPEQYPLPDLTSPSGFGEPPAEDAEAFSTHLSGWVGSMLCSLLFRGFFQFYRFS
ncbi:MAG: hypothetical protein PHF14_14965, partial [Verrucomicrobiota bacterium]|nr:hypothetical protein [Verrucomicrobiota bacterium]